MAFESLETTLLSSAFGLVLLLLLLVLIKQARRRNPDLPPCPPKLPVIGNLHQLGNNPHRSLAALSQTYGPIIYLQLGQIPTIVVSSAKLAGEVMKTHDLALASRPPLNAAKYLFYNWTDVGFAPYGPYWRQVRKICILELLSAKRVKSLASQREEEIGSLVQRITSGCHAGGGLVNLTKALALFANGVICRAAFGKEFSDSGEYDKHGFHKLLEEFQILLGGFSLADFFPSLEWVSSVTGSKKRLLHTTAGFGRFFDEVIEDHIKHRKSGGDDEEVKDLVDVLLDLKKNGGLEIPLTLDNIKAIILDMFAAGTDTSFETLDWGMTELVRNPKILKKAQDEVRSIVGSQPRVSENHLVQMDYLKAVIKEILRLYPPAPLLMPRESREEITFDGFKIQPNTRIYVNAWAIMRDPTTWDNPELFDPERFIGSGVDFKGQDFELIPFGAGRRICPGIIFAMANVELAFAQMLHSFDWELPPGVRAEDMDMSEVFGLTMPRVSELIVVARPHFV